METLNRLSAHNKTRVSILGLVIALGGMSQALFAATSTEPTMSGQRAREQVRSVALFYGTPLPIDALSRFDWVVVEPAHVDVSELEALRRTHVRVFAYLSVGEARREASIDPEWVLGTDDRWDTFVMDPVARGWRQQILAQAAALERQGYGGLFLDTLDSYAKVVVAPEARRVKVAALVDLVRTLRAQHPGLQLFFNRGFEVLDQTHDVAAGVAAESVFFGWDQAARRYVEVAEADRAWLVERLQKLKARLRIPVVAIDYLPPSRSAEARVAARRLEELGFIPWISTPELDRIAVGASAAEALEPAGDAQLQSGVPRLLLLYDRAESSAVEQSLIARLVMPQVQALGFVANLLDVRTGLPPDVRTAGYTGVVSWFTDDDLPSALNYPAWISRQISAGVRVVMLGRPGFPASRTFLDTLGLSATLPGPHRLARIEQRDSLIGHEAEPRLRARDLLWWHAQSSDVRVHLRIEDDHGTWVDPVITAPWGGLALQPYVVETGYQGRTRWIVDPRAFLSAALGPHRPAVTTLSSIAE